MMANLTNVSTNNDSLLHSLNSEKAEHFAPLAAFFIVLMLFGIIGNSLVCYVYKYCFRTNLSNNLIVLLAALDLTSCCIHMPSEVAILLFPITYSAPAACKLFRFVGTVTALGSCVTLTFVAFDRYYKACRPFDSFPVRKAKVVGITAVSTAVVLASPVLVIFGNRTVKTKISGLNGSECAVSDAVLHTVFPSLYLGLQLIVFVGCLGTLIVLYSCIGYRIHKQRTIKTFRPQQQECGETPQMEHPSSDTSETIARVKPEVSMITNKNTAEETVQVKVAFPVKKKPSRRTKRLALTAKRTSAIFFVVTLLFILSFLPYLILMKLHAAKVAFHSDISISTEIVYHLVTRSFFLNNTCNPIIYGVMNLQFRKECLTVFGNIFGAFLFCKRKLASAC